MEDFIPGQRWVNDAELQKGLGMVMSCDHRTVTLVFPLTDEELTFARETAALSRIRFSPGDQVTDLDQQTITVESVAENDGLLFYSGRDTQDNIITLPETRLAGKVILNNPLQRLLSGQVDRPGSYELRYQSLKNLGLLSSSTVRGLCGGRTSLIPHQLYIAHEVSRRFAPRVLLADEVGLGKTIEAGMILHQQLLTGAVERVLIIVPDSLVHQWLVEMLRRFNLYFSIFDQERYQALKEEADTNPFDSEQLVLCSLSFLNRFPDALAHCQSVDWDLMVVDEAHHLSWHDDVPGRDYLLVEQLAQRIRGILLLTATPEQLGRHGHFARLRLLDQDRFSDYEKFTIEEQEYTDLAELVECLKHGAQLDASQRKALTGLLDDADQQRLSDIVENHDRQPEAMEEIITHLLDRHGTGRVMFRNTRAVIKGFPERHLRPVSLDVPTVYRDFFTSHRGQGERSLYPERDTELVDTWYDHDPRIAWLCSKVTELRPGKVLVIAHHADTAVDIVQALRKQAGIHAAVFHQGMTLVERDRAAAYFANAEEGTQVLVCSEIGSEGRNFQFAHDLVLFDLPLNPDLLEQRIGRLDRIGQAQDVQIHVPYFSGTPQETLLRWYHEGLSAFEQHNAAGKMVYSEIEEDLLQALDDENYEIESLIDRTKTRFIELEQVLHDGRDRLLEHNSCRIDTATTLLELARQGERQQELAVFLEQCCDAYGIKLKDRGNGYQVMKPGSQMMHAIPGLPEDGMTFTTDRQLALANEDIAFLTWEHPLVGAMIENTLAGEMGNTSVITIQARGLTPGTLLLESSYVLEAVASPQLKIERYLPPVRIRVLLDERGQDYSEKVSHELLGKLMQPVELATARQVLKARQQVIAGIVRQGEELIEPQVEQLREQSLHDSRQLLQGEIERLLDLQQANPNIRDEEIVFFREELQRVEEALQSASPRLDALRVIVAT